MPSNPARQAHFLQARYQGPFGFSLWQFGLDYPKNVRQIKIVSTDSGKMAGELTVCLWFRLRRARRLALPGWR